jgi:uncharacterized spore protein YtfJ
LETILGRLKHIVTTETVVGQPIALGEVSVLPIVKISVGFAAGGGEGKGDSAQPITGAGGGGGGGASITPIGFIVWDGQKVQFVGLGGKNKIESLVEAVPELLQKFGIGKKKEEKAGASAETGEAKTP